MNRMPSEAKQEHLQWRRDKILELSSKGVSEREIVRLKSRLQQQAEWLDQHHKHREDAIRGRLAEKDQQINVLLRKDALNTDSISIRQTCICNEGDRDSKEEFSFLIVFRWFWYI